MKKRVIITVLLVLAALSCTTWAAGEPELTESYDEVELFQCGSLGGAQTIPGELNLLARDEEGAYQRLYQGLLAKQEEINVSEFQIPTSEIATLFERVVNDNPELFYVDSSVSWSFTAGSKMVLSVFPSYVEGLPADAGEKMEQAVTEALSLVEPGMSQAEKALVLHDYLMNTVTYDWETATTGWPIDNMVFSAYGALVNKNAVCNGYALAYQMLLKQVGINAVKLTSGDLNHAWNLVEINGSWYHVDVTWDDPVPDVKGGGRHENFLRSDAGMDSTGHTSWDATSITCPNDYIEDWWMYETRNPIYRWDGAYYYVSDRKVYRTDTLGENPGEVVVPYLDRAVSNRNGIQWVDGQLYYTAIASTGREYKLMRCELATGAAAVVGQFPFSRTASADGHYGSSNDGIGLDYDREAGTIAIYSDTRPEWGPLYTFAVRSYPVAWDSLPLNADTLAGCVSGSDGILRAGLVWTHGAEDGTYLAAAFYRDGKLVAAQLMDSGDWTYGLNVLELDTAGCPAYDRVALFLLSDSAVPLCASWQSETTE